MIQSVPISSTMAVTRVSSRQNYKNGGKRFMDIIDHLITTHILDRGAYWAWCIRSDKSFTQCWRLSMVRKSMDSSVFFRYSDINESTGHIRLYFWLELMMLLDEHNNRLKITSWRHFSDRNLSSWEVHLNTSRELQNSSYKQDKTLSLDMQWWT